MPLPRVSSLYNSIHAAASAQWHLRSGICAPSSYYTLRCVPFYYCLKTPFTYSLLLLPVGYRMYVYPEPSFRAVAPAPEAGLQAMADNAPQNADAKLSDTSLLLRGFAFEEDARVPVKKPAPTLQEVGLLHYLSIQQRILTNQAGTSRRVRISVRKCRHPPQDQDEARSINCR